MGTNVVHLNFFGGFACTLMLWLNFAQSQFRVLSE